MKNTATERPLSPSPGRPRPGGTLRIGTHPRRLALAVDRGARIGNEIVGDLASIALRRPDRGGVWQFIRRLGRGDPGTLARVTGGNSAGDIAVDATHVCLTSTSGSGCSWSWMVCARSTITKVPLASRSDPVSPPGFPAGG